jgi:aminoglycoside phosphotransferase family enzyme
VDWLVKMRRLPRECMLDHAIRRHEVRAADIGRVALWLARFYRACQPISLSGAEYVGCLADNIKENLRELGTPAFGLPADRVERIGAAQLGFLQQEGELLRQRARAGRIIEGHGDLRPEHVCMGAQPAIIDCLEFKRDFRILDAADELAFLAMECERLGEPLVGPLLFETYSRESGDYPSERLLSFYKSYRACLRAKISVWHLKDAQVRQAEKWPRLAREYLRLAEGYLSVS